MSGASPAGRADRARHPSRRSELLCRLPQQAVPGFEEPSVHVRGDLGALLGAKVITKGDDIDGIPHGSQECPQVFQVHFHKRIQEGLG